MSVTAHITGTAAELDLLADALDEAAERRRRTAIAAAAELKAEQADVTAGAVLVVDVLAEAATLGRYAAALRAAAASNQVAKPEQAPAGGAGDSSSTFVDALTAAQAAVAAARAQGPNLLDVAAAHNAGVVNGRTAWVAPGVDDDDDDLDAQAVLLEDMQA